MTTAHRPDLADIALEGMPRASGATAPTLEWCDLIAEVDANEARLLVDERAAGRVVVLRADGTVWEAHNAYHRQHARTGRIAQRWPAEEAELLLRMERQQELRVARLQEELRVEIREARVAEPPLTRSGGLVTPRLSGPTWLTLLLEVAHGQATVLESTTADGALSRIVVRRTGGGVWEAHRQAAGEPPPLAIRWTDWEAERFTDDTDADQEARCRRLEAHIVGALARARSAPLTDVAVLEEVAP